MGCDGHRISIFGRGTLGFGYESFFAAWDGDGDSDGYGPSFSCEVDKLEAIHDVGAYVISKTRR